MNFNKFRNEIKTWGLWKTVYLHVMEKLNPVLTLCEVHVATTSRDLKNLSIERDYTVAQLNKDEMLTLSQQNDLDISSEFVINAYAKGDFCTAAICRGAIVSYNWTALSDTPHEEDIWLKIPKGYAYGYKSFTAPEYRRKGLLYLINNTSDTALRQMGIHYKISFVETHNYASLISAKKRHNKTVGYAGYLKIFGLFLPITSPGARKHGFCFYQKSAPL